MKANEIAFNKQQGQTATWPNADSRDARSDQPAAGSKKWHLRVNKIAFDERQDQLVANGMATGNSRMRVANSLQVANGM